MRLHSPRRVLLHALKGTGRTVTLRTPARVDLRLPSWPSIGQSIGGYSVKYLAPTFNRYRVPTLKKSSYRRSKSTVHQCRPRGRSRTTPLRYSLGASVARFESLPLPWPTASGGAPLASSLWPCIDVQAHAAFRGVPNCSSISAISVARLHSLCPLGVSHRAASSA